jgi:hypothetical protein
VNGFPARKLLVAAHHAGWAGEEEMNIDLALHMVRAALRSSRELSDLLPFLKDNASKQEFDRYAKAIATAIASIQLEVVNKLTDDCPGLEEKIDSDVTKFGRLL